MAKNKKRRQADKIVARKKNGAAKAKPNPFELHINRQKHTVIGRKAKHEIGKPGISKAKAITKRKETLLQEYKMQFKSSKFVDRRIGENDPTMSLEEKMVARYGEERRRRDKKTSIFNLDDDETLTHLGQSLAEIEKFDDPRSDDEDDDKMAADLMRETHFGGFLTKKENADKDEKPRNRKDLIDELIALSKKRKFDRQAGQEKAQQEMLEIDASFALIRPLLHNKKLVEGKSSRKDDSFDVLFREMRMDGRVMATDRLQTDEELAKREQARLAKLEEDRVRRMKGLGQINRKCNGTPKTAHRSADDLDDAYENQTAQEPFCLLYKDGRLVSQENIPAKMQKENSSEEMDDEDVDSAQGTEPEQSESDDGDEDNFSDIQTDNEADGDKEIGQQPPEQRVVDNFKDELKLRKQMMNEARTELPYMFTIPERYDEFVQLVQPYGAEKQAIVIERMIKCNHPSLADGNLQKLETLFAILLQHINDSVLRRVPHLEVVDSCIPFLYDLAHASPKNAAHCIREIVMEKSEEFDRTCEHRTVGSRAKHPGFDVLVFFKIATELFPASDFRHPVTTPICLFMCKILTQCPVGSRQDVASGLFVCGLLLEFVRLSGRLVPEALNYLHGILTLCSKSKGEELLDLIYPFKPVGIGSELLQIEMACAKDLVHSPLTIMEIIQSLDTDDQFRVNACWSCLQLLMEFAQLYRKLPSFPELFAPAMKLCKKFPKGKFPPELGDAVDSLLNCANVHVCRRMLVQERERVKPLHLFEPKVEERFDGHKRRAGNKKQVEQGRLKHKLQQETKGAIREIRLDNRFLANQKIDDQLSKDAERKRKVKDIFASLANQEGDYKALQKKKKKM